MSSAVGIHDHPGRALGRRPPKNAPAIRLADILTGTVPAHPVAADHFAGATFGLYGNDQYGDCGPVSVANMVRLVSVALAGRIVEPSLRDVFVLYQLSGNPRFDPDNPVPGGPGDNGVDMQTMLEALLKHGVGDGAGGTIKPVAFAKIDVASDAELDAAVSIFGANLWGVTLEVAQQSQTDASPPRWDYSASGVWGGHAIVNGKYVEATGDAEVISWDIDVQTTLEFRRRQLEEAWVVVWPWNVDHPAFQEGVDLNALKAAYKSLTGEDLNVSPQPAPGPAPAPAPIPAPPAHSVDQFDRDLYSAVAGWAHRRHEHDNKKAADAILTWARSKGMEE